MTFKLDIEECRPQKLFVREMQLAATENVLKLSVALPPPPNSPAKG